MDRQDIFEVIQLEREYQDTAWPRDTRRQAMYEFSAPHILLLEDYVAQLRAAWTKSRGEGDIPKIIAKIATISVRALEEIKFGEVDLLEAGLR